MPDERFCHWLADPLLVRFADRGSDERRQVAPQAARSRQSAATVVAAAGVVFVVGRRGGTAALALPGLVAFEDGEGGDGERDGGIGPPDAEGGVEREACEHSGGEVGAEQAGSEERGV